MCRITIPVLRRQDTFAAGGRCKGHIYTPERALASFPVPLGSHPAVHIVLAVYELLAAIGGGLVGEGIGRYELNAGRFML